MLFLLLAFVTWTVCRNVGDGETYPVFAEEEEIMRFTLETGFGDPIDWGNLGGGAMVLGFRNSDLGQGNYSVLCVTETDAAQTRVCRGKKVVGFECATGAGDDCIKSIDAIEVVIQEEEETVIYAFDKGNNGASNPCSAKLLALNYADRSFKVKSRTLVSGTTCSDNAKYSLTVDPTLGNVFVTEVDKTEGSGVSKFYVIDANVEQAAAKNVFSGWDFIANQESEGEQMNFIYAATLTQKYSVIAWSPTQSGNLYLADVYYPLHSNDKGYFKGKHIVEYATTRKESGTLAGECKHAVSLTSDQNSNIYFLYKPAAGSNKVAIKLWKGSSCVILRDLTRYETLTGDNNWINDNIHISDENIMFLQKVENEQNTITFIVKGLYIGAEPYTYLKDHYESVVDESTFMGAVFGTYFGALVIGVVIVGVRILLAKRNR